MEKRKFPDGAWPVREILEQACDEQLQEFRDKCKSNPDFDWDLTANGIGFDHGTAWSVRSARTGHVIEPYVIITNGSMWYIGQYVASGGRSVTVVPMRRRGGGMQVAVVFQVRAQANTPEHPDCHIMAGMARGAGHEGESLAAAARREAMEETGLEVEGELIELAHLYHDANLVKGGFGTFAAFMVEPQEGVELDASEKILKVEWMTLPQLMQGWADGVTEEYFGERGMLKVNWGGSLEFDPIRLAIARVPELCVAYGEACMEHAAWLSRQ